MFKQVLDPLGNLGLTVLVALIPVLFLLVLLAVFRVTAWLATLIGSILTLIIAIVVWHVPVGGGIQAYLIGSANGIWAVDWITFWGVIIFNTLSLTGLFDTFKKWLVEQATADVRVQAILLAWALGALLEGLVGFGYPWAVIAPILIALGVVELDAIRVAAIANSALVSFGALLLLLRFWRPKTVLGYGGVVLSEEDQRAQSAGEIGNPTFRHSVFAALLPFLVLVVVVVLWTGPWSPLPKVTVANVQVKAISSISHKATSFAYPFAPFIAGTSILVSWLVMLLFIRPSFAVLGQVFRQTFRQMWGALLVGVFIFGLAFVFNYSGMAASLAFGFSKVGAAFILLAPILGWIGVALSGSNTSTNTLFGLVQVQVGRLLGFPVLLLPTMNSVGAEVGKPVAPQTASVGVSTSKFVRNEGQVIRHNMGWTLVLLGYLIIVGLIYYFLFPGLMR